MRNLERYPVRASFALSGAGSLGTFIAGALSQIVSAIRAHNLALSEVGVREDDPRLLHPEWGRITIDAIGGASAGALCSGQLVKSLFQPAYLGEGAPLDAPGTMTGDWINNASFEALSIEGNEFQHEGSVEAPGWTLLNAAKLYDVARDALTAEDSGCVDPTKDPASPVPEHGMVGVGITLTDLLGYHEHAEFDARHVMGHPSFGMTAPKDARYRRLEGRDVRDLGVKKHAEVRRFFVSLNQEAPQSVERFLKETGRQGQAMGVAWRASTDLLARLAAASAALPLALGPVAVTDTNDENGIELRRIYMDGGVLNNKPLSPALQMSRWQDEMLLVNALSASENVLSPDRVEDVLSYKRVCFFLDAFPDRTRGHWRSPHPHTAMIDPDAIQLHPENVEARNARIDEALATPAAGMAMFFESLLTSLRAQDIRGVANTNLRIGFRRKFIQDMAERGLVGRPDLKIRDVATAHAYAAVSDALRGMHVGHAGLMALTDLLKSVQQFSGTDSRREVTMIPVFAPENLTEVLAGDAIYAVGGLLSRDARVHDAGVGRRVATEVLAALRPGDVKPVELPKTPDAARPHDSGPLVERLRTTILATIEGRGTRQTFLKRLVAAPVKMNPLVKLLKTRLDKTVRGIPSIVGEDGVAEEAPESVMAAAEADR